MKRRFTLLAIAAFFSTSLMAAWDGTTPDNLTFSGEGTEANPYKISTEAELAYLAKKVNDGTKYANTFFKQTADLDLGNKQWVRIGKDNNNYFSGSYDGDGYVISNLYYNDNTKSNVGLFGYIMNATLTNITIANGFVYGSGSVGGVCGAAYGTSEISYCANNATVYGKQEQNGGICGCLVADDSNATDPKPKTNTTTITHCINYGLVSGFNFIGGIAGRCNASGASIQNCVNVGQVFSMCATSGCILGFNDDYKTIANISNNYFDNQINTLNGSTSKKNGNEPTGDYSGNFKGMATSEIIGYGLQNILGENNWDFATGMYPRLKLKNNNDDIIVAATPVILSSGDKADNVTANFTVSKENNVSWKSEDNTSNLSFSGTNVSILKSTGVVLIATKGSSTKKVYLKTNKTGATPIGSENAPLTIESKEDLKDLRDAVNNYGTYKKCAAYDGFKGIHFKLTIDIELTDWNEPIGTHNAFKGVFDGNHRTITNVNINQSSSCVGGLFGGAAYGEIKNITVYGSVIGSSLIGGICGATFYETLTNCISYCNIDCNGKAQVGGIAGDDRGFSTFTDCENHGTIKCGQRSGGILGRSQMDVTLDGCKNYGDVTANADNIGGICGQIASTSGGGTVTNCENHGTISATSKTNTAGIIGSVPASATKDVIISNCINSGNVSASKHIGGIVGHPYTATVRNCLNLGTINGSENVGGITGLNEDIVEISNSFNAGGFTGSGIAGNLAGTSSCSNCINIGKTTTAISGGSIIPNNSFYDCQLCTASGGTGKKTSQMVGTALQETLGTADWTYTDNMYPMIKTLENSEYMIMAATTIVLDAADELNAVKTKFHISTPHAVEWECDPISVVAFSGNNAYLAKTTLDQPAVVTAHLGKLKKTFDLTIKAGVSLLQPDIVWNIPQTDFTYGDKLTTAMQNATESHGYEGHFEFNFDENHALSVGGHNLTATFIPNDEAIAIKVASNAITVSKAKPTINWSVENGLKIYYGTDADEILKTAKATLNGEDVSDEGTFYYTIPALIVDSHVIKVKFISDNYESDEETRDIEVVAATPAIAWATPLAAIDYGTPLSALQLGAVSGVEGTFEYKINDEVVTADMNKILDAGTYTIVAKFTPQTSNYSTVDDIERTLVVNPIQPTVTWANPDAITYGTAISATHLNAEVESEYATLGTITYSEGTTSITDGMVLDVVEGGHIITATFTPKSEYAQNYNSATTTAKITINKAPANVQWSENLDAITYGTPLSATQLCATSAADGVQFTYTVTIDGNSVNAMGAILPAGDERVINAVLPESNNYSGWNGYRTIKVNPSPTTITWDDPEDIFYGTLLSDEQLNATATAIINGETVTVDGVWTYEPGKNTKLNASDNPQELTVKFTSTDNNFQSVEKTIAHIIVKKATPEIEWNDQQHLTYGASTEDIENTLKNATAKFDGVTLTGDYAYTLPLTTDLQAGADNITAEVEFIPTGEDANNFESANAVISIAVDKADPTITWTPIVSEITYGTELSADQLNAETNGVGEIVYTDDDEDETVLANGSILYARTHTITATLPESSNYNEATATATIIVNQAETSIEWETPAPIAANTPISAAELNATANVDGNFAYTLNGEDAEGQTLGVGNYTITATFTPNSANYKGSTATITLQVVQAAAEITWATPEAITYGTAISSVQLNATSEIDGTFYYKPDDGAILPAGDTSISVIFVPDSPDYGRALDTVKLTVNKAELSVSVADITVKKGDAIPEFVISYDGFVNNENESVLTTAPTATCATTTDEVGEFEIVVSGGESDNYNITYTNGKLIVVEDVIPETPVITWADTAITYGTLINASILNAKANVEGSFTYSVNVGDTLKAGVHELIATFTPASSAEAVTSTIKLTVNKAKLSVSVADATVNQGDNMPQFKIDYNGFVLDENISNLTTIPSANCNATTDNAGTFDIVISGGEAENYDFEYNNGKLTVNAKEDTTAISGTEVKISVYPNPTADVFFVETDSNADIIYIYNMTGKLVATEANVGKTRIDLTNEPQGTYFVKVGKKTIKVLKF